MTHNNSDKIARPGTKIYDGEREYSKSVNIECMIVEIQGDQCLYIIQHVQSLIGS